MRKCKKMAAEREWESERTTERVIEKSFEGGERKITRATEKRYLRLNRKSPKWKGGRGVHE
jgi:hypothetical protein